MRVLHIVTSLEMGGAEKLLLDSLNLYKNYNVDVDLAVLSSKETVIYNLLKKNFNGKIFLSRIKNWYSPMQILFIRKFINKYDLIHVHLFPCLYWTVFAQLFSRKVPLIFTKHSTENRRLRHYLFRIIDRIIYTSYARIIAITPQVGNVLIEKLDIKPQKIKVIYNGINIYNFKAANTYKKTQFFKSESIILLQVSSFNKAKDQQTLIKALSILPNKYKLLLAGDGILKKDCELLTENLNLGNRVSFLGIRMDIPELLKTSDIVIQSSHWEGFGLSAVEGMAAGKPVIASNVTGLADIVKNNGLLFEKGNAADLAKKIMDLENKEYYHLISERCKEKAKEFDINKMVSEITKIYQDVLEV